MEMDSLDFQVGIKTPHTSSGTVCQWPSTSTTSFNEFTRNVFQQCSIDTDTSEATTDAIARKKVLFFTFFLFARASLKRWHSVTLFFFFYSMVSPSTGCHVEQRKP